MDLFFALETDKKKGVLNRGQEARSQEKGGGGGKKELFELFRRAHGRTDSALPSVTGGGGREEGFLLLLPAEIGLQMNLGAPPSLLCPRGKKCAVREKNKVNEGRICCSREKQDLVTDPGGARDCSWSQLATAGHKVSNKTSTLCPGYS